MTQRISSTIAALAITLGVHAYDHADIQGTTFTVDTIEHYYVGPGLTHSHFSFASGSRVFQAYILKLDTTATAIETDSEDFHSSSEPSSERITPL